MNKPVTDTVMTTAIDDNSQGLGGVPLTWAGQRNLSHSPEAGRGGSWGGKERRERGER